MDPYSIGFLGRLRKSAQDGTAWFSDYPSREEYLRTTLEPDKYENYFQDREAAMRLTEDAVDPAQWPEGLFERFRDLWESRNGMAPRAGNPVYERHPEKWFSDSEAHRSEAAARDRRALADAKRRLAEISRLHADYKGRSEAAERAKEIQDAAYSTAIWNGKALGTTYGMSGWAFPESANEKVLNAIRETQLGLPGLVGSKLKDNGWMANIGSMGDVLREARNSADEAGGGEFMDPVSAEKLIEFGRKVGGDPEITRRIFDSTGGDMNLVTALSALGSLDDRAASALSRAYADRYRSSRIPHSLRPEAPEFLPGSLVPKTEYTETENGFIPSKTTYGVYEYPSKEWKEKAGPYLKDSRGNWIPEAEALINGRGKWHDHPNSIVPAKAPSPALPTSPSSVTSPASPPSISAVAKAPMGKSASKHKRKYIGNVLRTANEVLNGGRPRESGVEASDAAVTGVSGPGAVTVGNGHKSDGGPGGSGSNVSNVPNVSNVSNGSKAPGNIPSENATNTVVEAVGVLQNILTRNMSEKDRDRAEGVIGMATKAIENLSDRQAGKVQKAVDRAARYVAEKVPGQTAGSIKEKAVSAIGAASDTLKADPKASASVIGDAIRNDTTSKVKDEYTKALRRKPGQPWTEYLKQVSDYYVPIVDETASKFENRTVPIRGRIENPLLPGTGFKLKTSARLPSEALRAIRGSVDNLNSLRSGSGSVARSPGAMGDLGERMMNRRIGRGESASTGAVLGMLSQSPGLSGAGIGALLGLGAGAIGKKGKRSKRMLILSLLGGALGGVGASAGSGAYAGVKARPYAERAINNAGAIVAGMSPLAGTETASSMVSRVGSDKVKALKGIAVAVSGKDRKVAPALGARMSGNYRNGKGGK